MFPSSDNEFGPRDHASFILSIAGVSTSCKGSRMQIFLFLFMIALALTLWGRGRYLKIYGQETEFSLKSGITGKEMAEKILQSRGIDGVEVVPGRTVLEDFYCPEKR